MSNGYRVDEAFADGATTVSFSERFQSSTKFEQLYNEGMALVNRTAAYLDGRGRREAKALTGGAGVLYATESMRLTTRLLDLASWLLIRRALREGEISEDEAKMKRRRVKLQAFGRPGHVNGFASLPEGLKELIEESFVLHDRICQIDRMLSSAGTADVVAEPAANPVAQQMGMLERAFATKLS